MRGWSAYWFVYEPLLNTIFVEDVEAVENSAHGLSFKFSEAYLTSKRDYIKDVRTVFGWAFARLV